MNINEIPQHGHSYDTHAHSLSVTSHSHNIQVDHGHTINAQDHDHGESQHYHEITVKTSHHHDIQDHEHDITFDSHSHNTSHTHKHAVDYHQHQYQRTDLQPNTGDDGSRGNNLAHINYHKSQSDHSKLTATGGVESKASDGVSSPDTHTQSTTSELGNSIIDISFTENVDAFDSDASGLSLSTNQPASTTPSTSNTAVSIVLEEKDQHDSKSANCNADLESEDLTHDASWSTRTIDFDLKPLCIEIFYYIRAD